jgi:hypothetical protein
VREAVAAGLRAAREEERPTLIEVVTYRYRGHSAADPEVYREREEVEEWREKDPIESFGRRCVAAGVLGEREVGQAREAAEEVVRAAVEFADASPEPALDTMYESLYALTDYPGGWYAVDERSPEPHRGEQEADMPARARELAEAGAAYAEVAEEGERPNPAVHGDAQDGSASRVGGDADLGPGDQAERFGAEADPVDGEAAARDADASEERED